MSLQIKNIEKTYHSRNTGKFKALSEINLELDSGHVMALIGQNGAGKTTLMKCMLGLLRPDHGEIKVDGNTIQKLLNENGIGYMPDGVSNMGSITGRQYIQNLMTLRGVSWDSIKERFEELLKSMYLTKYIDIPMEHCSKGNLKKVIFIQSILHRPKLLILDEPTDGLDPISRKSMLSEIKNLKKEGCYTVISTHLLSDIEIVADDIMVLQRGRLLARTAYDELHEPVSDWYVKKIIESGEIDEL